MIAIKQKLKAGNTATMVLIRYPAPALVERIGELGFDAVLVDCEKGSVSTDRVEEMCRAARASGIASVVRPWTHDAGLISRYLDIGADGVMVAAIDDAKAASALVEAVRYARYADFDNKLVIGMIESPQAIANLPSLLEVDGIDAWFIGPNDLAQRMGKPGKASDASVRDAVNGAIRTIANAGRIAGIVTPVEDPATAVNAGARLVLVRLDDLLAYGSRKYKDELSKMRQAG